MVLSCVCFGEFEGRNGVHSRQGRIRVLSSFCFGFKRRGFDKCNDKVWGLTLRLKITCLEIV